MKKYVRVKGKVVEAKIGRKQNLVSVTYPGGLKEFYSKEDWEIEKERFQDSPEETTKALIFYLIKETRRINHLLRKENASEDIIFRMEMMEENIDLLVEE